jgi:tetratricopeptide (TPR) repeat protein
MSNNKDLTAEEIFELAVQNHKKNKLKIAEKFYNKVLKINPSHVNSLNNLAVIMLNLEKIQGAISCYAKLIKIDPKNKEAHYNLGVNLAKSGKGEKAKICYEKVIEIDPNNLQAYYNLGLVFKKLGEDQKAKICFEKAIEINPNYANAHNSLGNFYARIGEYLKAKSCYEKAIKIDPNYLISHYNLGMTFENLADNKNAKICYDKAIEIDPNYTHAYYNSHSLTSEIDQALSILKRLNKIDNKYIKAKIMIAALECYKGNHDLFKDILNSSDSNHPYTRSIKWVFSLPKLPKIFFNRWDFFDAMIALTENSRPFYEYGVWNGSSFKYLINNLKKGFGFDTFTGLPESWHAEPEGTYSSFGSIPKISGGKFITGKFEDSLPKFFSKKRPLASLINFDADLYSSTLCALNFSNQIIDEKTILIFDEFIINDNWEQDEFKALNHFCDNFVFDYEVLAVSFYTKQVAVKLKKKHHK